MQALVDGINNQQMQAVWNFLPGSYQKDVNGLVHEFATKMDPEMYDGAFQTGQRVAKLLQDKKEFILKNPMIEGLPVPQEKVSQYWAPTVGILSAIMNSDVSSLDKLKTFDGGTFLSTTGNQVAKDIVSFSDHDSCQRRRAQSFRENETDQSQRCFNRRRYRGQLRSKPPAKSLKNR